MAHGDVTASGCLGRVAPIISYARGWSIMRAMAYFGKKGYVCAVYDSRGKLCRG